ncbi:MAG: hypothetical protein WCG61_04530 [Chlorobium sp.]
MKMDQLAVQTRGVAPVHGDCLTLRVELAIRTLGGGYQEAKAYALKLLTPAPLLHIEQMVIALQVMKGKSYEKVLKAQFGYCIPEAQHLGIPEMLSKMVITQAELDMWYSRAEQTKYSFTSYTPLPDKSDCKELLDDVRFQLLCKKDAAHALLHANSGENALFGPDKQLTKSALVAACEMGMWALFFPQHKLQAFMTLRWDELPKQARLEFFGALSPSGRAAVWLLPTAVEREAACRKAFEQCYTFNA